MKNKNKKSNSSVNNNEIQLLEEDQSNIQAYDEIIKTKLSKKNNSYTKNKLNDSHKNKNQDNNPKNKTKKKKKTLKKLKKSKN